MGEGIGESAMVALTRDEVYEVLRDWKRHEWQVQGFGMLRTYLDGPGEPRLQVWDQRLACWGNNAIHDHPWAFESTIYAGLLYNQRFTVTTFPETRGPNDIQGYSTVIVPGTRGGRLSEQPVDPCLISLSPVEVYSLGDRYSQTHREMHLTRYAQGTVTLITRSERESADLARIAWHGEPHEQPPFVNPYPAPRHETRVVIENALETWWL